MSRQPGRNQLAAIVCGVALLSGVVLTAGSGRALAGEEEGATYARVRHLEDDMTIARAAEGEIIAASLNAPILPGDRVWTEGHRAEIELADASLLWVDEWTRVGFRSLTDVSMAYADHNLIVLEEGSILISTYDPEEDAQAFQIDSEAGTIYLLSGGEFRIDAGGGVTTLSSISGVAELSGDGGSILVRSGEKSSVRSGLTPSEPRHFNTARLDEFGRYSEERSLAYLRGRDEEIPAGVREEVPLEVHHYIHELSAYGRWYSVPSYGWVWRPAYHGAWSPYHDGYWSWCASGWSWVSYEPWGWAPYHYGRWDHEPGIGWVWIPGRSWSGAWVSFAVGPTYVGWAPLNYYNRPVFHDARFVARGTVTGADLDTRGWSFARHEQFTRRDRATVQARGERMPQDSKAVITRSLPRFDARATAKRPEPGIRLIDSVQASRTPLPLATDRSGQEIEFRKLERPPAGPPRSPQRGVRSSRDLSAGAPGDGTGAVPLQPRGRPGAVPPPGRSGLLGAADGDGKPLRSAPRSLGLNLEKEKGAAPPDRGTTGPQKKGRPASPDQASGPEEKRRRPAVEQLFRGSRKRPGPKSVDDETRPEKQKANPPAEQGRSTRGR
ncbi:MAG TPA: DUF6600 domain-containing protein, partial [Candidatus Polarisedimenticolia bacterium]|nr:DUF6600 domain-containing protein [Candidatus Polarisedimenticolia bacterium]